MNKYIVAGFLVGCLITNAVWLAAMVLNQHQAVPFCVEGQKTPTGGCITTISPDGKVNEVK